MVHSRMIGSPVATAPRERDGTGRVMRGPDGKITSNRMDAFVVDVEGMSRSERLLASPFDFTALKMPVQYADPNNFEARDFTGVHVNCRSDNGKPLGIVRDRYVNLQPEEFMLFAEKLEADGLLQIMELGQFGGGRELYIKCKLPGISFEINGGDKTEAYYMLRTSLDGTVSLHGMALLLRLWCMNQCPQKTLMAMAGLKGRIDFSGKHTASIHTKMHAAAQAIREVGQHFQSLGEYAEKMAGKQMSDGHFGAFSEYLVPNPKGENARTGKAEGIRASLFEAFKRSPGNRGETVWDAFNAVTYRNTFMAASRSDENRYKSLLGGANSRLANRAGDLLHVYVNSGIDGMGSYADEIENPRPGRVMSVRELARNTF
jgi:phage/plasmid-like protein (TIGR03299 family)